MGRNKSDEIITDYAINWGIEEDLFFLDIDLVNWYEKQRKSILLGIYVVANKNGTDRYLNQLAHGIDWMMKETAISLMWMDEKLKNLNILVQRDETFKLNVLMRDTKTGIDFKIRIKAVLMGEDNNSDMLIHFIDFINMLDEGRNQRMGKK